MSEGENMISVNRKEIVDKYKNCDYCKVAIGQTFVIGIASLVILLCSSIVFILSFALRETLEGAFALLIVLGSIFGLIFIIVSILFIAMLVSNTRVFRKAEDYKYKRGIVTKFQSASLLKVAKMTVKVNVNGVNKEITGQYLTKQTTMIAFVKIGITADVLVSVSKNKIIILSLEEGQEGIPLLS